MDYDIWGVRVCKRHVLSTERDRVLFTLKVKLLVKVKWRDIFFILFHFHTLLLALFFLFSHFIIDFIVLFPYFIIGFIFNSIYYSPQGKQNIRYPEGKHHKYSSNMLWRLIHEQTSRSTRCMHVNLRKNQVKNMRWKYFLLIIRISSQ